MKINIITPFYRTHLIPTLIHYLEPMGIDFYPMVAPEKDLFPKLDWIHPIHTKELAGWPTETCFRKINDFLDLHEVVDDDYYGFMTDDDMYEPGFFDVIRKQTAKIIICSLYRGDTTPSDDVGNHPTYPLLMRTLNDIRVCNIGLPQYIIKGEIFRQNRFSNTHMWGDGMYAVTLKEKYANDIVIITDLWALGGYFQPGRYTTNVSFVKRSWKLPEII